MNNNNNNNNNDINNSENIFKSLRLKSTYNVPSSNFETEDYIKHTQELFSNIRMNTIKFKNISMKTLTTIKKLNNNKEYIIKAADKNLGLTTVTHEWYRNEMHRQILNTNFFKPYTFDIFTAMKINTLISQIVIDNPILFDKKLHKYITQYSPATARPCTPYLLPKIHKLKNYNIFNENNNNFILNDLQGRLIISCVSYITTPLSQWLDALLQPLVRLIPTICKDSKTFINNIENLVIDNSKRKNCILFTADITSLYPNIPTDEGIKKVKQFLNRSSSKQYLTSIYPCHQPGDIDYVINIIIKAFDIVLKNNIIEFENKYYLQINGTAMGQSSAVVYANIYVYECDQDLVNQSYTSNILLFYIRFIDDVFAVLYNNNESKQFIKSLNSLHPSLEYNCITSDDSVEFLDCVIYKGERFQTTGCFDIRVHQKITNKYIYIPYNSHHTIHNKKAWIKAELSRYIRNTSSHVEYIKLKIKFYNRLRERGYSHKFLCSVLNTVAYSQRHLLLQNKINNNNNNN